MTRTEYRATSAAAEIETPHVRSNIRATMMPPLRLLLLFVLLLLLPNQSASLDNETPNPNVDYYTLLNLTLSHLDLPLTSLTKYHYNINSRGLTPFTESSAKKSYRKLARKYHPDKNRKSTTKTTKLPLKLRNLLNKVKKLTSRLFPKISDSEMFHQITSANDVLQSETDRTEYDNQLEDYILSTFPESLTSIPLNTNFISHDLTISYISLEGCLLSTGLILSTPSRYYYGYTDKSLTPKWDNRGDEFGRCSTIYFKERRNGDVVLGVKSTTNVHWNVTIGSKKRHQNHLTVLKVINGRPVIVDEHLRLCNNKLCRLIFRDKYLWCGGGCFRMWRDIVKEKFKEGKEEEDGIYDYAVGVGERFFNNFGDGFEKGLELIEEGVERMGDILGEKIEEFWELISE